jgi:hypothetical protein
MINATGIKKGSQKPIGLLFFFGLALYSPLVAAMMELTPASIPW